MRKPPKKFRRPSTFVSRHAKNYADESTRRSPVYKQAVRMEKELHRKYPGQVFGSNPLTPAARQEAKKVMRAFERAHFYDWADNYRRALSRKGTSRDASYSAAKRHGSKLDAHARMSRDASKSKTQYRTQDPKKAEGLQTSLRRAGYRAYITDPEEGVYGDAYVVTTNASNHQVQMLLRHVSRDRARPSRAKRGPSDVGMRLAKQVSRWQPAGSRMSPQKKFEWRKQSLRSVLEREGIPYRAAFDNVLEEAMMRETRRSDSARYRRAYGS